MVLRPSPSLAVAVVALAVAIGGVAIAGPGDGGLIHGCYSNDRGALRVVDAGTVCEPNETATSWNQMGPQGPKGDRGDAAPALGGPDTFDFPTSGDPQFAKVLPPKKKPKLKIPKPQAESGEPTQAFTAHLEQNHAIGTSGKTIVRLDLPKGSYVVMASAQVIGNDAHCAVRPNGAVQVFSKSGGFGYFENPEVDNATGWLSMNGGLRLFKAGALELQCYNATLVLGPALTAIRVAKVKDVVQ